MRGGVQLVVAQKRLDKTNISLALKQVSNDRPAIVTTLPMFM